MAHKMGAGSTKNDRDSQSKRLELKQMEHKPCLQDQFL